MEESFIVLGTSPTPSMDEYFSGDAQRQESMTASKVMATCTNQTNFNNNFSLIHADESLKSMTKSVTSKSNSIQSTWGGSNPASLNGSNSRAATAIVGETNSSMFQTFPSLMNSSMPIDEIQMLQHLMEEHGQMKENLQKANVDMRKNFTDIKKWQDEANAKYADQIQTIDEQCAIIVTYKAENDKLKQMVATLEIRAAEQEKRATELKVALEDEMQKQIQAERASALAEIDDLKKVISEKESILKDMAREIERLEQLFVVVKPNHPTDGRDSGAQVVTKEEHDKQINVLQQEMSVIVAKNLVHEEMIKVYVDELNCMRVDKNAAEDFSAKNRVLLERQAKDIETKDISLAENIRELKTLAEQVDDLTVQLDTYKINNETERTARAELASEKDRILTDLKLLQKRNQDGTERRISIHNYWTFLFLLLFFLASCMRVNNNAAEEFSAKYQVLLRQAMDIETKNVSLAKNIRELKTLAEQVDDLTVQLDIYKINYEAERTMRAELASEKDRLLTERNQHYTFVLLLLSLLCFLVFFVGFLVWKKTLKHPIQFLHGCVPCKKSLPYKFRRIMQN